MSYVVVNIGCIECGVSSNVVGVFESQEEAERVADKCDKVLDWRGGGQNHYEAFELPAVGVINPEYAEVVNS